MKVKDLIEALESINPEHNIIMGKDAEGNNYSPLSNIIIGRYLPESPCYGYVEFEDDMDEDSDSPVDSIVLFPVN